MRRRHISQSLELPLADRHEKETRQAWVYRCVRERILAGELRRGDRLPSTRTLAERWGVSRGIVELAFEQLTLEGYVVSRVGAGTEVLADLAGAAPTTHARREAPAAIEPLPENAASLALKTGRSVDTALFSLPAWRRHMNRALRTVTAAQLADTDPRGYAPLRESIARYVRVTRGIACEASDIVVTTGIRHAIDLITQVLADATTWCYLEDPGYKNLSALIGVPASRCVSVPVDDEGFALAAAAHAAGAARRAGATSGIAYVTPAHQAPLGTTMSINRRMQLLEWAARHDVWIVEDDYDSEFSYGSAPLPALKAIDAQARVIHCSSFNKSLFPSLRIGYLIAPPALLARIALLRSASGRANSLVEQMALASYIDAGDFARHLRASRSVYLRRRNLLLDTLRATMTAPCRITGEHAGFHCVLWLPAHVDEAALVAALRERDVYVEGLAEFARARAMPPALVLGYAALDDARLPAIATQIAAAVNAAAAR
ncbi:PLP-dependent aminotransferase family protein [Pandoraea nosoerga]|uniref:GntR family transcriptional regulator n=1 Tax=Pandoraea nosoerga TaxID=2508296 RepID=A0A5E4XQT0_9BURK|nr:PLP-dependent aminotransferase family protein [Pandoraea nosoerga]MBN4667333.1 PLP-dependent aminotransferase family protein [Pandoraea nosoerga]MBN4677353.1 PLP-dependent aminotransferase family protein [Pandoraea nosoerga]MBN4683273.1 PLP-dependent aminotransferase family protein [Pandoraea nosoerga]MBN4747210.1 PLP-dependent aminotransferase family protein [Pandoraea nosoerga]VVE38422.1 GntR family transcriptional regulator [Pandoraea nosoerga]